MTKQLMIKGKKAIEAQQFPMIHAVIESIITSEPSDWAQAVENAISAEVQRRGFDLSTKTSNHKIKLLKMISEVDVQDSNSIDNFLIDLFDMMAYEYKMQLQEVIPDSPVSSLPSISPPPCDDIDFDSDDEDIDESAPVASMSANAVNYNETDYSGAELDRGILHPSPSLIHPVKHEIVFPAPLSLINPDSIENSYSGDSFYNYSSRNSNNTRLSAIELFYINQEISVLEQRQADEATAAAAPESFEWDPSDPNSYFLESNVAVPSIDFSSLFYAK